MIRAVIFDLDGTLYDRYSSLRAAAYQLHSEHRNWFPESMIAKELGRQLVKFDHRYNYFGGWPSVAEKLKTANVLLPEVDDREFGEAAISAMAESLVPYPFTLKMLADLRRKGYRLGMITNGTPRSSGGSCGSWVWKTSSRRCWSAALWGRKSLTLLFSRPVKRPWTCPAGKWSM